MKTFAKDMAQKFFLAGDRVGVHVMPSHYYSSVASRKQLKLSEGSWRRTLDPLPFEWDIDRQAAWLAETVAQYPAELPLATIFRDSEQVGGFRYGPIEAQFLYSYIRAKAPKRIVEIGSGSSTLVMSKAVDRNLAESRPGTQITAMDPYTAGNVSGLAHVDAREVGGLSVSVEELGLTAGDVLFIDSTHTLRTGSELFHLYLEVLPQLAPGVVVHIHDIYLPYLYAPNIYESMFDWQETTLLAALLAGNNGLSVLASLSGIFHARPDALAASFTEFQPAKFVDGLRSVDEGHFPSSIWLQVEAR